MSNPLFLLVGRSASGKTTIADILEKEYGYTQVRSYTTRKPRYDGEPGHIFITREEFKNLEDVVSYTLYHENEYGTTAKLLDNNSIFVVDVPGVESLLEKYKSDRPICIIYFDTSVYNRINRMLDRGNCDTFIVSRLLQDEKDDWYKQLDSLVWKYANILGRNVQLYSVNANNNLKQVLELVLYYMKRYVEG